jgi:hypothetical protein
MGEMVIDRLAAEQSTRDGSGRGAWRDHSPAADQSIASGHSVYSVRMLEKRRKAAAKYRPERVRILVVAEAPPCDVERHFYFEDVDRHDWLFRYVYEGLYGEKPTRERKPEHLARLRDDGVFVIELHEENVSQPTRAELEPCVPGLVERCRELRPRMIVLVKASVHDAAFAALKAAGLPVADVRIPFPTSGQQRRFLELFREAMRAYASSAKA